MNDIAIVRYGENAAVRHGYDGPDTANVFTSLPSCRNMWLALAGGLWLEIVIRTKVLPGETDGLCDTCRARGTSSSATRRRIAQHVDDTERRCRRDRLRSRVNAKLPEYRRNVMIDGSRRAT
jgi:hypothetical protein